MAQIDAMFLTDEPEVKPRTFGGGTGGTRNLGSGIDTVSGDSKIAKNLTININELMSGNIEIHSQTVTEGSAEIKEHVINALLSGVNDVNTM